MRVSFFLLFLVIGCVDDNCLYLENKGSNYAVNQDKHTGLGIRLDDDVGLDTEQLQILDNRVITLEECLKGVQSAQSPISLFGCYPDTGVGLANWRNSVVIKITDEYHIGHMGTELLYLRAQDSVCAQKQEWDGESCYYRVSVQNCTEVIVPPSMELLEDGLIRVITGCAYPWRSAVLRKCMGVKPK